VNAIFSFLAAISLTLKNLNLPKVEWFIFYILNTLLITIGIEYFLNIIASFYRSAKVERKLPFDSKILYLLSLPEEVIPSFSEIIEYQFGFRITQTWFYQFIKKRIVPLLLIQITFLYLLTCIVIVRPYERCFIEFLGRPIGNGKVFGPGLHFKFPWPISKAKIYDVERIKTIRIGAKGEEGERLLWTEKHYKEEFNWIIASKEIATSPSKYITVPVNFMSGVVWVYYKIDPDKLFDYAYSHAQPDELLKNLVRNQFTRMMMKVDFHEVLTVKRLSLVNLLKEILQQQVDKYNLGIKIVLINLGNVHPPVEVARSFEKVVGAMERKEAYILDAEAYKNKELTLAHYKSSQINVDAEAYKFVRSTVSKGQREKFLKELIAYRKNPRIFKYRHYLNTLEKALLYPIKYIVVSSDRERNVTIIDLEKTPLPEILSLGAEIETKEEK
ncbi:protease modulator HflK, partial [bacterium]|nr:protease modulator HflK [bacterium]